MAQIGPKITVADEIDDGATYGDDMRLVLRMLQALIQANVRNVTLTAPPVGPYANGDTYVVAPGGTGAWAGHDNAIAYWTTQNPTTPSGEWNFFFPLQGWSVFNLEDRALWQFDGTAWGLLSLHSDGAIANTYGQHDLFIDNTANAEQVGTDDIAQGVNLIATVSTQAGPVGLGQPEVSQAVVTAQSNDGVAQLFQFSTQAVDGETAEFASFSRILAKDENEEWRLDILPFNKSLATPVMNLTTSDVKASTALPVGDPDGYLRIRLNNVNIIIPFWNGY